MAIIQSDPIYAISSSNNMFGLGLTTLLTDTANLTGNSFIWNVLAGQCRDSTDSIDLMVGVADAAGIPAQLNGSNVAAPVSGSLAVSGVNGLDTGTVAASTPYYIYLIGDSRYLKQTATIASLSGTAPLLPFGYDSFRMIGYLRSSGTGNFILPFSCTGSGSTKYFQYQASIAALTGGTQTVATAVSLVGSVPSVNYGRVSLTGSYTSATIATDFAYIRPGTDLNLLGGLIITGATAATASPFHGLMAMPGTVAGVAGLSYNITANTGSLTLRVTGFEMNL